MYAVVSCDLSRSAILMLLMLLLVCATSVAFWLSNCADTMQLDAALPCIHVVAICLFVCQFTRAFVMPAISEFSLKQNQDVDFGKHALSEDQGANCLKDFGKENSCCGSVFSQLD